MERSATKTEVRVGWGTKFCGFVAPNRRGTREYKDPTVNEGDIIIHLRRPRRIISPPHEGNYACGCLSEGRWCCLFSISSTFRVLIQYSKRTVCIDLSCTMPSVRPTYLWLLLLSVALRQTVLSLRRHPLFINQRSSLRRAASLTRVLQQLSEVEASEQRANGATAIAAPVSRNERLLFSSRTAPPLFVIALLLLAPGPSQAGLLEEYGGSSSTQLTAPPTVVTPTASGGNTGSVQIDPTLRGCTFYAYVSFIAVSCSYSLHFLWSLLAYYYPTAKKRYLPRILKASEALAAWPSSSSEALPDEVSTLTTAIEDAILPLQLYQSSLTGQGLSLNNEYAVRMKRAALQYERAAKQLTTMMKAKKPDAAAMNGLVEELTVAMQEYRTQGRLDDASIPPATVEEMRRMAMRNQVVKQQP
jgi:hypothetical protein